MSEQSESNELFKTKVYAQYIQNLLTRATETSLTLQELSTEFATACIEFKNETKLSSVENRIDDCLYQIEEIIPEIDSINFRMKDMSYFLINILRIASPDDN